MTLIPDSVHHASLNHSQSPSYPSTSCLYFSLPQTGSCAPGATAPPTRRMFASLRRAVRSPHPPPPISRPSTTSIATSFASSSHQRRHSSSKPPVPPSDNPANAPGPSVKTVGAPRSKLGTGEKRAGAESRSSRRKIARDRSEHAAGGRDEWAMSLPIVASTQHIDPKDVYVASFFSNHRPMSLNSAVPPSTPEEVFQSIFTPRKPTSKSKPGTAEVIYTLSSALQTLDSTIAHNHNQQQPPNQQQGPQERSDLISALTPNNTTTTNHAEPQHLDGSPQHTISLHVPNGVKLAIQQIARQFRPFNPPPAPQAISDEQIEAAKEAEDAAAAEEADELQALQLEEQIKSQDLSQSPRHMMNNLHERRVREGQANRFFTSHTTRIERSPYSALVHQVEEEGGGGLRYDVNDADVVEPAEAERVKSRLRPVEQMKSPGLRRRRLYTISVKRQRRLKMKKHKYKKLMRRTRTLRRKLDQ